MSATSSGRLSIPHWGVVSRVVTALDITTNEFDVETSRTRSDLTNAVIYFTVRDSAGTVVIEKTSANAAEILKLDQGAPETMGQARVYFVADDTSPLIAGANYWFDCWASEPGNQEPIVDRGKFIVLESVTDIANSPAPYYPGSPAPQTVQARSFRWVVPTDGDDFTVTIPGVGMLNAAYHVGVTFVALPVGGAAAVCLVDETVQTTTTFNLKTSGVITAGTVFTFYLRDL